jgi:hypothetical protein
MPSHNIINFHTSKLSNTLNECSAIVNLRFLSKYITNTLSFKCPESALHFHSDNNCISIYISFHSLINDSLIRPYTYSLTNARVTNLICFIPLISFHLISSHFISFHLISSHLISSSIDWSRAYGWYRMFHDLLASLFLSKVKQN